METQGVLVRSATPCVSCAAVVRTASSSEDGKHEDEPVCLLLWTPTHLLKIIVGVVTE